MCSPKAASPPLRCSTSLLTASRGERKVLRAPEECSAATVLRRPGNGGRKSAGGCGLRSRVGGLAGKTPKVQHRHARATDVWRGARALARSQASCAPGQAHALAVVRIRRRGAREEVPGWHRAGRNSGQGRPRRRCAWYETHGLVPASSLLGVPSCGASPPVGLPLLWGRAPLLWGPPPVGHPLSTGLDWLGVGVEGKGSPATGGQWDNSVHRDRRIEHPPNGSAHFVYDRRPPPSQHVIPVLKFGRMAVVAGMAVVRTTSCKSHF
eukprot:350897-Chlamydomonas_euryale.AAC.1